MNYWLDLFTPYTWTRFREHGTSISGFRPRQRHAAFEKVMPGDLLLCYLVKLSRWCGVLEVVSAAFEDHAPIFAEENDPFPVRFKVTPIVVLDFEHAIPIEELWDRLSFTKTLVRGSVGWAQAAKLRQSLIQIGDVDGEIIKRALDEQARSRRVFELDASDLRHVGQRTVIRTEQGEVEVEVPDREEEEEEEEERQEGQAPVEVRASLKGPNQTRAARRSTRLQYLGSAWRQSEGDRTSFGYLPQQARDDAAPELRPGHPQDHREH